MSSPVWPEHTWLGLGGNLGDVLATFTAVLTQLPLLGVEVLRVSSAYQTDPLCCDESAELAVPMYWNAVCEVRHTLLPLELLNVLFAQQYSHP